MIHPAASISRFARVFFNLLAVLAVAQLAIATAGAQVPDPNPMPTAEETVCPETLMFQWNSIYFYSCVICNNGTPTQTSIMGTSSELCDVGCSSSCCGTLEVSFRMPMPGGIDQRASRFQFASWLQQPMPSPITERPEVDPVTPESEFKTLNSGVRVLEDEKYLKVEDGPRFFLLKKISLSRPRFDASGSIIGNRIDVSYVGQEMDAAPMQIDFTVAQLDGHTTTINGTPTFVLFKKVMP